MPPKANESIDSFFSPVSTDAHSNIDMLMLEAGLYEHKESIRQAEFPRMAEFLAKYADVPPIYYKKHLKLYTIIDIIYLLAVAGR